MKYTLVFIAFLFLIYIVVELYQKEKNTYGFMSRTHTCVIKGLAALMVILQHVGNICGTRLVTPLGGAGVAMFLIASGYGLNESYKNKVVASNKRGGVLEKQIASSIPSVCHI